MAKSKLKSIDDLIDVTSKLPSVKELQAKQAVEKQAEEKQAEEKQSVEKQSVEKIAPVPMEKREKLPDNAVAPSANVLDHLKSKRAEENKRALSVVGMKKTGEIILPSRITAIEGRLNSIEDRLNV